MLVKRKKTFTDSSVSTGKGIISSSLAAAFSILLVFRSLFDNPLSSPLIQTARTALPSVTAAVSLFFLVVAIVRARSGTVSFKAANPLPGILIGAVSVAIAAIDVIVGVAPLPVMIGSLIIALGYWPRPKFLLAVLLPVNAAYASLFLLDSGINPWEHVVLSAVSVALSLVTARIMRNNVLPGAERLKYLEKENRELWGLSYRDTLTGLYNRRYAQQTAEHLFNRAVRYKEPFHVLMIDIDHFKSVNDKLGHSVGDEVLKKVSSTLLSFVRTTDTVARYGGEEFIVYVVQANSELTQFIANRIRDGIAGTKFEEVPWQITISIGVAGIRDGDTLDSLVERADQYLYRSKHDGRNRVSGF